MPYKIRPKRSGTVGRKPAANQLDTGEIALNMADKKLYFKDQAGTVQVLAEPVTIPAPPAPQTLSKSQLATAVQLTISNGNNVQITGATASLAGVMTKDQAAALANLQTGAVVKAPASQALQTINGPVTVQGNFRAVGTITATENIESAKDIVAFSDKRLKANLEPITDALARISQITAYMYDRIDKDQHMAGVIAQDVQKVLPEAVHESETGYLAVSTPQLLALVLQAVNELAQKVTALES